MKPAALFDLGGVPIDRLALRTAIPGVDWIPDLKPGGALIFDLPPPMASLKRGGKNMPAEDITGMKAGRLTAVWHWGRNSRKGLGATSQLWVCRCTCGRYTVRNAKSIKDAKPENMCNVCNHIEHLKYLGRTTNENR